MHYLFAAVLLIMPGLTSAVDYNELNFYLGEGTTITIEEFNETSGNASVETHITTQANDHQVEIHNDEVSVDTPQTKLDIKLDANMEIETDDVSIKSTRNQTTIKTSSPTSNQTVPERLRHKDRALSALLNAEPTLTIIDIATTTAIQSEADVTAYASLAVQTKRITEVTIASSSVAVSYLEGGMLFGLLPIVIEATATVDADGEVGVQLPWYHSVVFGTDQQQLEDKLEVAITQEAQIWRRPIWVIDVLMAHLDR